MTESIWKREKYGYSRRDNYNVSVRDNPAENGVLIGRPHLRGWRCEVFWFVATNILAWLETSTRNHRIPHCLINRRFAAIKKFYSFFFFPKRKNCLLSILFNYFSLKKKTNQGGRFFLTFFEVIFLNIIQRSRPTNQWLLIKLQNYLLNFIRIDNI